MRKIKFVTVLMPVFNGAEYVKYAMKSILNQTFRDFEFLIIDDGSTDGTAEIVSTFKDTRINYQLIKHGGLGNALNYGLHIAAYDWVARMDADDLSHPLRLEKQIHILNNFDCDVISCKYAMFTNKKLLYTVAVAEKHEDIKRRLALHSEISHPGVLYNRKIILEAGGYSPGVFEDYELWLRVKDRVKFYITPDVLCFVNYRSNSYSRKNQHRNNIEIYNIQAPYYDSDISAEFMLRSKDIDLVRGWREFFYGDRNKARIYWNKTIFKSLNLRLITGYLLTFLGDQLLSLIKENRIRFRVQYLFNYYSTINRELRLALSDLLA